MGNDLSDELKRLDAIIDLHEQLLLPKRAMFYLTQKELDERMEWVKQLASSGTQKKRFPRTQQRFDMLEYCGYKFYYLVIEG